MAFNDFDFGEVSVATREGQKARLAVSGLSGSGKTYSSLVIAKILTSDGNVLVIDTEKKSSGLYADEYKDAKGKVWKFDVLNWLPPFDPRKLTNAVKHFSEKYDAIIIDSHSHFWSSEGGLLEIVDNAGRGKGNYVDTTKGWKVGTPIQNEMIDAILRADCHVILCMRARASIEVEKGANGKLQVRKIPLKIVQREDTIFEMTIAVTVNEDHSMTIDKSRYSKLEDMKHFKPGNDTAKFAEILSEWLNGAEAVQSTQEMEASIKATLEESIDEADAPKAEDPDDIISATQLGEIRDMFGNFKYFQAADKQKEFVELFGSPADLKVGGLTKAANTVLDWLEEDARQLEDA